MAAESSAIHRRRFGRGTQSRVPLSEANSSTTISVSHRRGFTNRYRNQGATAARQSALATGGCLQIVTETREPRRFLFRIPQVSANVRALCAGTCRSSIESSAHEFRFNLHSSAGGTDLQRLSLLSDGRRHHSRGGRYFAHYRKRRVCGVAWAIGVG